MSQTPETDLRYPIGKFKPPRHGDLASLNEWITEIEALPERLSEAVLGLSDVQLGTPYRRGGWTVRQLIHHLADSHINSYVRFRLALTEDVPRVNDYKEAAWAELPDASSSPVALSQELLSGLHSRWVILLRSMSAEQFGRSFEHPERGAMRLDTATALYAWHSKHHVAHITALRQRSAW